MNNNSKVSILIPTYNRESIIMQTLESALQQTYSNIEVIVVDNCSTDKTYEICLEYQNSDSRVFVYKNEKNIGPVRNWLECVKHSTGDFIKFLWSDDWIDKDFIEKTSQYLENDSVAFVYSSTYVVSESFKLLSFNIYDNDTIFSSTIFEKYAILGGNVPLSPGCALFRRIDIIDNLKTEVPNRDNLDFNQFGAGNDLLIFLLPLLKYEKVAYLNSTKSYFRYHEGSLTVSNELGLYYAWAKCYYLTQKIDYKLKRQFKSHIWLMRIKHKNYRNILHAIDGSIDLIYLFQLVERVLLRRLKLLIKYFKKLDRK